MRFTFEQLLLATILAGLVLVCGCPPLDAEKLRGLDIKEGEYLVSENRLYDDEAGFDLKWNAVYASSPRWKFRPDINVTDKQLTEYRCFWCHECGMEEAWDWKNLGTDDWSPRYRGEEWGPVVMRMRNKKNSFLNEKIAERVYNYLRDESLGLYDESQDDRGEVVIEVDELPSVLPAESETGEGS